MSKVNDAKILNLKKDIEEKELKLSAFKKSDLLTNCNLLLDNERYNLQTMNKEQLVSIFVKVNTYLLSAKDLGIDDYKISGFEVEKWVTDIKSLLDVIAVKNEKLKLKELKEKLNKLLSDDKKVELELDNIEKELNL